MTSSGAHAWAFALAVSTGTCVGVKTLWGLRQVLEEIGAADIPRITIWNKLDLVQEPDMVGGERDTSWSMQLTAGGILPTCLSGAQVRKVAAGRESVVCLSAVTGEGVGDLLESLEQQLTKHMVFIRALIPFSLVRSFCVLPLHAYAYVVSSQSRRARSQEAIELALASSAEYCQWPDHTGAAAWVQLLSRNACYALPARPSGLAACRATCWRKCAGLGWSGARCTARMDRGPWWTCLCHGKPAWHKGWRPWQSPARFILP